MQPTKPDLIATLVELESFLHYRPDDADQFSTLCTDLLEECEAKRIDTYVDLAFAYHDSDKHAESARIICAILDSIAPRRSVLDFDGEVKA